MMRFIIELRNKILDIWDEFTERCERSPRGLIVVVLALIAVVLVSALFVPGLMRDGGENGNDSDTMPAPQIYEPKPAIAPTMPPTAVPIPTAEPTLEEPPGETPVRLPEIHTIIITPDFEFNPSICTIAQNDCIIWVNNDTLRQETYILTSDDGLWQPADIPYGSDFTHIFGSTGNYTFGCYYFPAMKGTVIVRER